MFGRNRTDEIQTAHANANDQYDQDLGPREKIKNQEQDQEERIKHINVDIIKKLQIPT